MSVCSVFFYSRSETARFPSFSTENVGINA